MGRKREQLGFNSPSTSQSKLTDRPPVINSGSARKRRRTTILDAFRSVSISRETVVGGDEDEDADSSRAMQGDADSTASSDIESDDDQLLSDREHATRGMLFEMVFGDSHGLKDPVEKKLQVMIRESMQQANQIESEDDRQMESSGKSNSKSYEGLKRSNSMPTEWKTETERMDFA